MSKGASVGSLSINLDSNYSAAVNGLSKADVAFKKISATYLKLESNINKGIGTIFNSASKIGAISGNIKNHIESLQSKGFDINADSALASLNELNENVFNISDGVQGATAIFDVFSKGASRGILKVASIIPKIGGTLARLAGPVGIVLGGISAIGVFTAKNFDVVVKYLTKTINFFRKLYNDSVLFRTGVESVKFAFTTVFEYGKAFFNFFKSGFKTIGKLLKAIFSGDTDSIGDIIKDGFNEAIQSGKDFISITKKNFNEAALNVIVNPTLEPVSEDDVKSFIIDKVQNAADFIGIKLPTELTPPSEESLSKIETTIVAFRERLSIEPLVIEPTLNVKSLGTQALENVGTALENVDQKYSLLSDTKAKLTEQIGIVKNALIDLGTQGVGANVTEVALLQSQLSGLQSQFDSLDTSGLKKQNEDASKGLKDLTITAEQFNTSFSESMKSAFEAYSSAIETGSSKGQAAIVGIFTFLGDLLIKVGQLAVKIGSTMFAVKSALSFASPLAALAAGGLAIATGKLFKSYSAPKLAKGGLAFGETLATVGDNRNSQIDPEVIAPLSKLKAMLGEQGPSKLELMLSGAINHRQILLSSEYGKYNQSLVS